MYIKNKILKSKILKNFFFNIFFIMPENSINDKTPNDNKLKIKIILELNIRTNNRIKIREV